MKIIYRIGLKISIPFIALFVLVGCQSQPTVQQQATALALTGSFCYNNPQRCNFTNRTPGTCQAFAVAREGGFYTTIGPDARIARRSARALCRAADQTCRSLPTQCNGIPG